MAQPGSKTRSQKKGKTAKPNLDEPRVHKMNLELKPPVLNIQEGFDAAKWQKFKQAFEIYTVLRININSNKIF